MASEKFMKVSPVLWGSMWAPWLGGGFPVHHRSSWEVSSRMPFSPAAGGRASAVLLEQ